MELAPTGSDLLPLITITKSVDAASILIEEARNSLEPIQIQLNLPGNAGISNDDLTIDGVNLAVTATQVRNYATNTPGELPRQDVTFTVPVFSTPSGTDFAALILSIDGTSTTYSYDDNVVSIDPWTDAPALTTPLLVQVVGEVAPTWIFTGVIPAFEGDLVHGETWPPTGVGRQLRVSKPLTLDTLGVLPFVQSALDLTLAAEFFRNEGAGVLSAWLRYEFDNSEIVEWGIGTVDGVLQELVVFENIPDPGFGQATGEMTVEGGGSSTWGD